MTAPDASSRAALDKLLSANGLAADRRLYREAMRDALVATDTPGIYRLSANPAPSESVVDVYGQGHVVQAENVGPGLAFAETARPNWQETVEFRALRAKPADQATQKARRVEVEVRLGDILEQGGLVYPVESVTVERAWYCTIPSGAVLVREVRELR
jgi:hypothetical protein